MKPNEQEEYITELWKSAEKIAAEIMMLSKKVKQRNKTLDNLLRLLFWMRFGFLTHHSDDYDLRKYTPKRGRKGYIIPLKFVMAYLGVSHRTAQDYVRTIQALDKLHTLFNDYVPNLRQSLPRAKK